MSILIYSVVSASIESTLHDYQDGNARKKLHWNLIITLMLGSIRNQCYIRIVL